jgi:hypothetical protein
VAWRRGIGLQTGPYGRLIDRKGQLHRRLYYLGPMLHAGHWEATAAGELRVRTEQLAECLALEPVGASAAHSGSFQRPPVSSQVYAGTDQTSQP